MIALKSRILHILKSSGGYVSGEKISTALGVSRTAIWKYIRRLRSEGYKINSVTHKGYRLEASPDIISEAAITAEISTDFFAHNVCIYDEIDSTNIAAKANAHLPDGTLFVAERQTKGRGRLGREWSSEKGTGIFMSILLKPDIELEKVAQITLAAGIGVCRALSELCGVDAKIKWPNDIVIGTKKVCGILTELSADMDGVNYVVVGIGINIHNTEFDTELCEKATSLYIETCRHFDRSEIIRSIMYETEKYYKKLLSDGFDSFREEYKTLCANIGKDVLIIKDNVSTPAHCTDISDTGDLIVKIGDDVHTVRSGEVSVRGLYGYI